MKNNKWLYATLAVLSICLAIILDDISDYMMFKDALSDTLFCVFFLISMLLRVAAVVFIILWRCKKEKTGPRKDES